jgi:hypothetical protein
MKTPIPENTKRWGEKKGKSGAAQLGGHIAGVFAGQASYGNKLNEPPAFNRQHSFFTSRYTMPSGRLYADNSLAGVQSLMTPSAKWFSFAPSSDSPVIGESLKKVVPNPEGGGYNT